MPDEPTKPRLWVARNKQKTRIDVFAGERPTIKCLGWWGGHSECAWMGEVSAELIAELTGLQLQPGECREVEISARVVE